MKNYLLFTLLIFTNVSYAQTLNEDLIEAIAENSEEDIDYTSILENLSYYEEHPLNLNKSTKQDLQNFLVLNEFQINALLNHIEKNGSLLSIYELQTIDGFNPLLIRLIQPYILVNKDIISQGVFSLKERLKSGKSELFTREQRVVEKQAGYSDTSSSRKYLGSPDKIYTRYRFSSGNKLSFGFTAEKDPGEEFFKGTKSNGFDFYSAHFVIKDIGRLKALAVGDYELQFGQGLTFWSGLAFGKSNDALNIKKIPKGIKHYTSVDENLFMRGTAATLNFGNFDWTMMYSKHSIDGSTLNNDELADPDLLDVSSFITTGNHRNQNELNDKHTVNERVAGTHLSYNKKNLDVGLTAVQTKYNKSLEQNTSAYNQFDFYGDELINLGADYNYLYKNVNLFGEFSYSPQTFSSFLDLKSFSYLNGAIVSLDQNVGLSLFHRNYSKHYWALHSAALGEGSTNINEQGVYIGATLIPFNKWVLSAYYDAYRFPWLRYLVDAPSVGYEYMINLEYKHSKSLSMYWRIKSDKKQKNATGNETPSDYLADFNLLKARYNISYKIAKSLTISSRIEGSRFMAEGKNEYGYLIYQDLKYAKFGSPVSVSLRYALFDVESYDARIYVYENDLLYAFNIPFFSDRGSRAYVLLHYTMMKGVEFWVKVGQTFYNNRKTIGSDLDEINGNTKTEVKLQMRVKF